jgi:hypothetical protein
MPRLPRRTTAALLGAVLAVGLPTGFALAAGPADRHGVEVSAVATNDPGQGHGAAVTLVARTQGASAPAAHPANHGAAVSAVAKVQTLVGGTHSNHGGAVAPVAHPH